MENHTSLKAGNDSEATLATVELIEKVVATMLSSRKTKAILRPQDSFYDSGATIEINDPVQVVFFPDQNGMAKDSSEIRAVGIVLIDDKRRIGFTFFLSMEWGGKERIPGVTPARSSALSKPSIIDLITSKGKLTDTVFTLDLIANNTGDFPDTFGQGRGFLTFDWERR